MSLSVSAIVEPNFHVIDLPAEQLCHTLGRIFYDAKSNLVAFAIQFAVCSHCQL